MEMREFYAESCDEERIILDKINELQSLYEHIKQEKDFIVKWSNKDSYYSALFIGSSLLAKLENGDLVLAAKEAKE